jgi:hypothetical protein
MGSLSETERKVVKDEIHGVAHAFLRDSLESIAETPSMRPVVDTILESNKQIRLFASVKEALEKGAERKNWSPTSLKSALADASLPGMAAIIGGGADIATGGAAFAATKAAQVAGKALNRKATFQLAKLVRAVKAGDASKETVLEAIRAGVPVGTVTGVLAGWHGAPDWAHDALGSAGGAIADAVE